MQTQSHILLALTLLSKKDTPRRNLAVFFGALIPDAFIYAAWAYYTLTRNSQTHIWDVLYFRNPTQFFDAFFNSVPLYLGLVGAGWLNARYRTGKAKFISECVMLFGLAALIHIASDFPVHASDAHRHLWPLSDWRFFSPLSYWEGDHHAMWVSVGEAILGAALCAVLWKRFPKKWVRIVLGICLILYTLTLIASLVFMS